MKLTKLTLLTFVFAIIFVIQTTADAQILVPNSVLSNGGAVLSDS